LELGDGDTVGGAELVCIICSFVVDGDSARDVVGVGFAFFYFDG
jgi:hypothetical protein